MRRTNPVVREESGFTLVEVIVAMALTTMLVGFAFEIYLLGQASFIGWQRRMRAQDQAHVAAQAISNELYHTDHILKIAPHSITLQTHAGKIRRFWQSDHTLMADSTRMVSHDLSVIDFRCMTVTDSLSQDSTLQSLREPDYITFTITVAIQKDTLTLERSVYLRKQSYWHPLK